MNRHLYSFGPFELDPEADSAEDGFFIKVDARIDNLRADPSFASLLQRIGLTSATIWYDRHNDIFNAHLRSG
jgi:hypothetical protein